jgi:ABC-type multidrug transport system ATPase subunit
MSFAVETTELSRSFANVTAVDGLNLAVPEGSVFGFLGPNGAGKTTTIRMLLGLIKPSAGAIQINGADLQRKRGQALSGVGAIVESPALYPNLTGWETVKMAARLAGLPASEARDRLEQVSLSGAADRRVSGYSLGMRQRLALARAMLGRPRLLILDEPTNGLDPAGIADMRQLIAALPRELGATVLLSSHLLSEIEQTATHCALIDRGKLVFQDRLSSLSDKAPITIALETDKPEQLTKRFLEDGVHADRDGATVRAQLDLDAGSRAGLLSALMSEGYAISGLWTERPSLEAVFLKLTGRGRASAQ